MATFSQRTDWANDVAGGTPVMAADMLRIEQGVADGVAAANAAQSTATTAQSTAAGAVVGTGVTELRMLTQATYDAITTKNATTVYVIVG